MKLTQKNFNSQAQNAAQACGIFFFCGPDEAGASAAARKIVDHIPQAGEKIELSGSALRADPALLGDEARTTSLFGDKRHLWVRATGDEAHDAVKALIETSEANAGEACPVVIVATSATDKSRTAKLLEKRKDACVAMFYPPDIANVSASVRGMGDAAGLSLPGHLAERIARGASLDVRLAQSEVDKLALYLDAAPQTPKQVQAEDLDAIGATTEEDGFMPLVNAVLSGDLTRLDSELARMRELRINPVGLLLAVERRAVQLVKIVAALGPGGSIDRLDRGQQARLGIFWRDARDIRAQLKHWPRFKLDRLVQRLTSIHRDLLANSQFAETLLAQELVEITRYAAKRS
ncbi:DNA polymerase III subunit delta [Altererythrobacter lutimaris]|uniref:DNA-directed DNA polymerase n=1 Tax=Altererythrobacter lutimaris TaxID=2743979 RepID=A0A850HBU7_9SPHN|nr:DNA polymerase III subunit delta [Altererythrobacter lutimaris]NVE95239.1 DNA polymerase III subunit delta [Altererythrobacter lutimaris]